MLNFRNRNWDIVGRFPLVSNISYAVILIGLAAIAIHGGLRLGLSFTGGTDVTVRFVHPVAIADVRAALATIGVQEANINTLSKAGETPGERYTIETQVALGNNTPKLWDALGGIAADCKPPANHPALAPSCVDRTQSEVTSVGPSLSHEYLLKAVYALIIAIGIQFLYIAFRFGWNYIFGLVTIIALVRDAAMMIGLYGLFNKRADDAFLAAVLTVIGYSVMDTIVILDRIRENTKLMDGEPYSKIVNTSILQTMTRSINTLATVVITLLALLLFGGASLQNFGFALLVGIVSGGYHSIFYSAPLVLRLREGQLKRARAKREAARLAGKTVPGERPRTVAEARAQAISREEVVAARKERRAKEKTAGRGSGQPVRYKRKRNEAPAALAEAIGEEHLEASDDVDPLDAQRSGVHDRDLELGHEEIHLNLEDEAHASSEAPHEHHST